MNYNTFDTTTGPQLIALDRQDIDWDTGDTQLWASQHHQSRKRVST